MLNVGLVRRKLGGDGDADNVQAAKQGQCHHCLNTDEARIMTAFYLVRDMILDIPRYQSTLILILIFCNFLSSPLHGLYESREDDPKGW